MSKTFQTLTDKPLKENYRVFVMKKLEEIYEDLPKAIRISSLERQQSGAKVVKTRRSESSESGNSKRACTEKIDTFEETLIGDVGPSMVEASAGKRTLDRKSSSLSPPKLTAVVENAKKSPKEKLVRTPEKRSSSSSPPKPPTIVENAKKRPRGKSIGSTIIKPTVVTRSECWEESHKSYNSCSECWEESYKASNSYPECWEESYQACNIYSKYWEESYSGSQQCEFSYVESYCWSGC